MPEDRDPIRTGAELVTCDGNWIVPKNIKAPVVVFIHGFTSHGNYLKEIARYTEGYNFISTIFNYDSYLGIDKAAEALQTRLLSLSEPLATYGFVLLGHSMGGLVARFFAQNVAPPLHQALRGIILLGTPNAGTLGNSEIINYMREWADALTIPHPFTRHLSCRAAAQLTLKDEEQLIESLNKKDRETSSRMPLLSISGGNPYLELSKKPIWISRAKNRALQKLIGEKPNDGLVSESSADINRVIGKSSERIGHIKDYSDYPQVNHTYLVQNQAIAIMVIEWLKEKAFR